MSKYWYNYKKCFLFAYPIIFVFIFSWGISFSDRYFIEYLNGTKDVAIYAILAQVAGIGQIIGQIYNSMYVNPKVLKLYEKDKVKGVRYLNDMLKKLALIFIILSFIAYAMPIGFYTILIERSLIEKIYYFWTFYILIIGIFLTVFQTAMSMYLILAKKLHILAYINGIAFLVISGFLFAILLNVLKQLINNNNEYFKFLGLLIFVYSARGYLDPAWTLSLYISQIFMLLLFVFIVYFIFFKIYYFFKKLLHIMTGQKIQQINLTKRKNQ